MLYWEVISSRTTLSIVYDVLTISGSELPRLECQTFGSMQITTWSSYVSLFESCTRRDEGISCLA